MKKIKIKNKSRSYLFVTFSTIILISVIFTSISTASLSDVNIVATEFLLRGDWEAQESGTTVKLSGVSFPDVDFGTTVGDTAKIIHTDDGGENWDPQTCGVSVNLYDVSFYDTNTGMAVGAEGTIIYTNNGGENWNTYQTGWMMSFYGTHMLSSTTGYAVGENTIFQPIIMWTTDGWNSDNAVAFYIVYQSVSYEGKLFDVYFIDSSTGFAAAAVWSGEGAIVRTTDGGWTWETVYWGDYAFYGIDFASADVGYAVGNNGIIVKTTDGGDNWQTLNSGINNNLADVSSPTEDIATAVGTTGVIIRTDDGGDSWYEEDSGTTLDLFSVDFIDSSEGYAVGAGGTILHHIGSEPPDEPEITGPSAGPVGIELDFTVVTTDPEDDMVSYYIDWGDGEIEDWTGPYPSGEEKTFNHAWTETGTYEIKAKAKDINNVESDWSEPFPINISNPPGAPTIDGPKNGDVGVEYPYTFVATDPDGDEVFYWIVWGDGCPAVEWMGPYPSGEIVTVDHAFTRAGKITISSQARDIYEVEGDWGSLEVEMPRNRMRLTNLFSGLFARLINLIPILKLLL